MSKVLEVFDPALCCISGVCGPSPDEGLMAFAGTLEGLKAKGVEVKRYNLAQQPLSFASHPEVMEVLKVEGEKGLPLVYWDGALIFRGRYPTGEQLVASLGLEAVSSCCGNGPDCCSEEAAASTTFVKVEAPGAMSTPCCDPNSGCC